MSLQMLKKKMRLWPPHHCECKDEQQIIIFKQYFKILDLPLKMETRFWAVFLIKQPACQKMCQSNT